VKSFFASQNQTASRTYYTHEYLEIVSFQKRISNIAQNQSINPSNTFLLVRQKYKKNGFENEIFYQGLLKKNIEKALSQPEEQIVPDDLKNLLYTAKSDEELDLVVNAIQKYETQSAALGKFRFNFGVLLMGLFYVQNKTDKALELFMSNVIATLI
jgi:hypothetical protein